VVSATLQRSYPFCLGRGLRGDGQIRPQAISLLICRGHDADIKYEAKGIGVNWFDTIGLLEVLLAMVTGS
jgi:hypothetical protein